MSDHRRRLELLLPEYEVRERIGQGEFGAVWDGRHRHLERRVAIKELLGSADGDDGQRFHREARILAALDHGNVVAVYDYREDDAARAIVMEHLDGGTFAQRRGECGLDEVLAATRAAATGIGHAHRRGVLHRDVKPSNLMFDSQGRIKVTDFGLASRSAAALDATIAGSFMGTPAYISPEQARWSLGDDRVMLTAASDQYSLAAVLYETLTGTLTHDATRGVLALCEQRVNTPARDIASARPDLPRPVCDAIMRALARDPSARHESIEAFGVALAPTGAGSTPRPRTERRAADLIGRDAELDELRQLVREHRLVTITAIGGVGKTALARALEREPPDGFRDGAHFVDLSGSTDAQQVRLDVRRALGLRDLASADATDDLADHLADRAVLLLLDNCEQVWQPVADLAETVLRRCPNVSIIATSRVPLARAGEQIYRLAPLGAPPASGGLDDLVASPATRLFVERARRQRPDFTIDGANAEAVREIARRLDGIPLALELAAARVRAMSAPEIAAHLDSRFRLLTARTDDPRHRTLLDTIAWSYAQLRDAERVALVACSVFVGGFDLEAAQALLAATAGADAFDAIDVVDQLVDRSLLQRTDDASGRSRYVLLESVKEYALEQAGSRDDALLDAARVAHLEHFTLVAVRDGPALGGPAQVAVNNRLRLDQENLFRALDAAAELPGRADTGLRLAIALRYFLHRNGVAGIMGARIERLCAMTDDHELGALGLSLLARAYCAQGRAEEALEVATRAARRADLVVGDSRVAGWVLESRALARLYAGDYEGGLDDARRLMTIIENADDRLARAEAMSLLAISLRMVDDLEGARAGYGEVADAYRGLGDVYGAAVALVNRVDCAIALNALDDAERDLESAASLVAECDSPELTAYYHGNFGVVAYRRNDAATARRELAAAIETSERIGDPQSVLNNVIAFAAVIVDSDAPHAAYLVAAADALVTRHALTPDPNEQEMRRATTAALAEVADPDVERARREGGEATMRAAVEVVKSLAS